jgi:hypothetical protein
MPGQNNFKRTAQHTLQLNAETGVGLNLYPGYEAEGIATEDGKEIVAEYIQVELVTQAGLELTTESNDNFETLGTNTSPDINGYVLETIGYPAAPGYNPQAMLRWSDDAGHTWSNEHWSSMGKLGQYGFRTFWRRLGMTQKLRDRVYEVSGTDPVKIAITNAEILLSPTNA